MPVLTHSAHADQALNSDPERSELSGSPFSGAKPTSTPPALRICRTQHFLALERPKALVARKARVPPTKRRLR